MVRRSLVLSCFLVCLALGCKSGADGGDAGKQGEAAGPGEAKAAEGPEAEATAGAVEQGGAMGPAELGTLAPQTCRSFASDFAAFEAASAADKLDPAKLGQLWKGSLKAWAEAASVRVGRGELPEGLSYFDDLTRRAVDMPEVFAGQLAGATDELRALAMLDARRLLAEVSEAELGVERGEDELLTAWDEAWCLWSATMRPLARAADALPERGGEGWEQAIVAAFVDGRAGVVEAEPGEHDPRRTLPARQIIEKGSYALSQRLLLAHLEAAELAQARALLHILEDRMSDRNGPGLARLEAMLADPHAELEAGAVAQAERDIAVAFVKRARNYCDKAVKGGELGSAEAIKGAWEGLIYTRVVLPGMREALADAGFDADAYLSDWEDYRAAVGEADASAAAEISARLVEWNCAYQHHLGIAACTATANESE